MKIRNYYKGFTLIELLIVLSIMGVLATLGFQSFTASQKKARDARRKSDLGQIQKALELYKMDKDPWFYPDLDTIPDDPEIDTWVDFQDELQPEYMKEVPAESLPDSWEWPEYEYKIDGSDTLKYILYACLENESDPDQDAGDLCTVKGVSYTITEP